MKDRSHFLITHDCGGVMDIPAYQKALQSSIIWGNGMGLNKESPEFPYKKKLRQKRRPSSLFCMGRGEDSCLGPRHFLRWWRIEIIFGRRGYPALFPNCAWVESRSGLSYELNVGKNSIPPPQLRISVSSFILWYKNSRLFGIIIHDICETVQSQIRGCCPPYCTLLTAET